MSDLTTYLGNKICRWLAGNAMPAPPASLYVALFNGNPKTSGVEVTDTIRAAGRLPASFAALAEGTGNVLTSDADVDFGTADGATTLTHVAIYDGPEDYALLLASKELVGSPISVDAGASVKFPAGEITFTIGSAS